MKEVTYDLNSITNKLGVKIANLEIALAHEQAGKEAYATRVKELELKLKEQDD